MQFTWSLLQNLTALDVHAMLQAREAVFVVEQQCAYQEADAYDLTAWHLLARLEGRLAAYARVIPPGVKYTEPAIGRLMTVQDYRLQKLGRPLMQEALRFTTAMYPGMAIRISAQVYLKNFYSTFGFLAVGEEYDEDGIRHIEMTRPPGDR